MKRLVLVGAAAAICACYTSRVQVTAIPRPPERSNSVVINKSRADVWASGVRTLAKRFFVINNLDQASGLINVSYSGDPQRYIGGPIITHTIEMPGSDAAPPADTSTAADPRPERDNSHREPYAKVSFPATQATAEYGEMMGQSMVHVTRQVSLEGRANIVVEEVGPASTRVTANVRYIVTEKTTRHLGIRSFLPETEVFSFNTGGQAEFLTAHLYPTGAFETELISSFEE